MTKNSTIRPEVMRLAHAIRKECPAMGWGQCQAQAWKAAKLKAALRGGVVRFAYVKQNGEARHAEGTLCPNLIAYQIKGTGKPSPLTVVRYFDTEKQAFRSFRAATVSGMAA